MSTNIKLPVVVVSDDDEPRESLMRDADEMTFDQRIPMELAAQLRDPMLVLKEYGYTGDDAFHLVASPLFQGELQRCLEEISQGLTFRQRAKMMAPDALAAGHRLVRSRKTPPDVRLAAAKFIVNMADVVPKDDKAAPNQAFQLVIRLD